ncbi:MAG: hypothetical protein K0S65_6243, partial [Labilithrix sp.]|nr:hypothetical protein [Labilithrix sp.]
AHARTALLERFKGLNHDAPSAPAAVVTPSPVAAPSPRATPSPLLSPPPSPSASIPAVAVDALPGSKVEPTMTVVTLPRSAKGHRVFFDGRVVASGAEPLKLRCGKHKIQIGSGGKARVADLPCGGELTLD